MKMLTVLKDSQFLGPGLGPRTHRSAVLFAMVCSLGDRYVL
jgi:hypothetical protein